MMDNVKFAIDYLIKNGHKMLENNNNYAAQSIKLAIKALEKQMPKKLAYDSWFGDCPECGKEFNSELTEEYDIKNCPWCGQRLDWRVEE